LLPSSIQNWINIVEPFDPLAFTMNAVFLLRNEEPVRDVFISRDNPLDDVHGCYWTDEETLKIIADSLQE
ncbi:MAG: hypothetical protein ACREBD_09235, partial [Blastocatellia bacterium]